ncbi:nuclease-related domain-containing protein [Streptomyces avermitilis]|uniref:nuclease-related domain-containing protein n=1 Tax=Streptomyces avermitilis TaxID=33903 RepID=UPI0033BB43E0
MSDLTVNQWKRHGKDRLYVNLPDGTPVAWADRDSKVITVKVAEYRHEAVALLRQQLGDPVTVRTDRPASSPPRRPRPAEPPQQSSPLAKPRRDRRPLSLPELTVADDLAKNPPGAAILSDMAVRGPSVVARAWSKLLKRPSGWESWLDGLEGEKRVGRELERLTVHGWRILHGIPKGNGGDIDHLLIGPGGVFVFNTKRHPGASVWVGDDVAKVNGFPHPYPAVSKTEAAYVRRVLERYAGFAPDVVPVLAFVDVASVVRAPTQNTVRTYQEREVSALAPLTGRLTGEQVESLFAVARHKRAWLRTDPSSASGQASSAGET